MHSQQHRQPIKVKNNIRAYLLGPFRLCAQQDNTTIKQNTCVIAEIKILAKQSITKNSQGPL